jgi:dihydroorotate dehydrogenase electron transfer subunit
LIEQSNRGTICLCEAEIISHREAPGDQYILRVSAQRSAQRARPGSFAHLTCDPCTPMRRPLSIMRANATEGWLEFLYRPLGPGLAKLARKLPGETVSILAPIGRGFEPDPSRPLILALGGGVGIPPMIFLAEQLKSHPRLQVLVLMGSEVPFPFELAAASATLRGVPASAAASVALLEAWGVPSRLASGAGLEGCRPGFVTDLARDWLDACPRESMDQIQILACGPEPMLRATAELARAFAVPCQIAVEEYMACGIGGCAGCTVLVHGPQGPSMKRVCVDGPVFDASEIYPATESSAS